MAYSTEVLRRARARLAMAKEDRESENREHLQNAYAKVPRLQEIDRQLRATMALAASTRIIPNMRKSFSTLSERCDRISMVLFCG